MAATVLLEHRLPDGSAHFDWMVDVGDALATFRVMERIDGGGVESFGAERLADHRREYLAYEGPVSGGRGEVRRVASGEVKVERNDGTEFRVWGRLGEASGRFEGCAEGDGAWRFKFVTSG